MSTDSTGPADCGPEPGTSAHALDEMWRGQLRWWHWFFAVLLATTVVVLVAEHKEHLGWQLACVVAIGIAYAVWGRRGLGERQERAGVIYLAAAWVLMLALMALDGTGTAWILTFGLFPQTWATLPRNKAATTVVLAVLGIALVRIWQGPRTGAELVGIAISTAIMLALSLTLGLFIDRIVSEADSRARTIDELKRAQEELAAAERAQGVAGERERISREIHDTLAQGFTSVVTLARATELALDRGDLAAVRERLRLIEQTAADNLSEARLIVAEMTPGHLQSRTLSEALQRLVDAVSAESGMAGRLRVDGEPVVLPANSEVVLLRTAQEGLSNVRRHSGATTFEVALSYAPDGPVSLAVSDNGVGFAPGAEARGYGLDGATARAAEVGGRFDVDSAPGEGSRLRVEVPR
ncbi:Signal transduction histidine kinase [Pedococcus dokdonensis]|uniref:Oxygen sensor histidine kinase NreB n=1 Tax=Pedococcus dokdonensis TaxID=443156 RepID=A0A1H0T4U9_9MICO|nr:sensor histidine kinase [Pedococcus dokdonensis]SDP49063.1 Signal transduction histidine kinase [Pedococcus dokdonensis]